MAARASLSLPFGALSTTSPVAGLITSYVCPELAPTGSPAMNIFAIRIPPLSTCWLNEVLYCTLQRLSTRSILHIRAYGQRDIACSDRHASPHTPHHHGMDAEGHRRSLRCFHALSFRP